MKHFNYIAFCKLKNWVFFIIMTLFKSCFSLLKPLSVIKLIFLLGKKSMDSKEEEKLPNIKPGVNANDQLCMCTRLSGSYIKVVVFTLLIIFFMSLCRSIHGGRRFEVWSIGPHLYRILKRNIPGFNWQAIKVSLYLYFYSPGASCRKQLPVRLSGIFFATAHHHCENLLSWCLCLLWGNIGKWKSAYCKSSIKPPLSGEEN